MKKFRFNFSTIIWVLLSVVVLLFIAGAVFNVLSIVEFVRVGSKKVITYCAILVICMLGVIFTASILAFSFYKIKGDKIYTCLGLLITKIKIEDVVLITHFKKSDKLVVYLKDNTYFVVLIKNTYFDPFVMALREANPKILYDARIEGEDIPS